MKKISTLVMCVFCMFSFGASLARGQEEPSELTKAKKEYTAELEKATRSVNERYLPKTEDLKKQLSLRGDIKGALAVEQATEKMAAGQSLGKENANEPQEMREIRKNYGSELEAAIKPVNSLYLAKLEVLKQQLATGGNLKGALVVEQEMDKLRSSDVKPAQPQSKTFKVSARDHSVAKAWLNTGLQVNRNSTIEITANGKWWHYTAEGAFTDVDGRPREMYDKIRQTVPGVPSADLYLMPERPFALIGKIGSNGKPFIVGSHYTGQSMEDGVLYLGFNDMNYEDNSGEITATVSIK